MPMLVALDLGPLQFWDTVVTSRAFSMGLIYGALAFLATGVVAALRRRTTEGAGVAFAVATFLAIRDVFGFDIAPWRMVIPFVLLGIGGWLAMRMRPRVWARWYVSLLRTGIALLPGAIALVIVFPLPDPSWLRWAAGAGALIAGVLVHDFDAAQGPKGAPFAFLALSALAVYYVVPDTELPIVMLGCAAPLVLISVPQPLRRLGPAGAASAMGVFAWVVAVGGRGRAGAVVAGIAAVGILIAEPLGRRIPRPPVSDPRKREARASDRWLVVVAVACLAQLALGAYCATIAGREDDPVLALLMCLPVLVIMGAAAPYLLATKADRPPKTTAHRHRNRAFRTGASRVRP